jgi:hypothetical protein
MKINKSGFLNKEKGKTQFKADKKEKKYEKIIFIALFDVV